MAKFPAPAEGIALTHFVVASDVDRSRRFYADVLGGEVLQGRRADDHRARERLDRHQRRRAAHRRQADGDARAAARPRPRQQLPQHPRRRHPRRLRAMARTRRRVPDAPDATGVTELRCYMRDPDGHLIEVGQRTDR